MSIASKRDLEIELMRLKSFTKPSLELEQYATPAPIAAAWCWAMAMKQQVSGKVILDAACGPGILGIGLLLLGAKKVFFVDKDETAMKLCQENYAKIEKDYEIGKAVFIIQDIAEFDTPVDVVAQNPPFGTKQEHADKQFLEKAFSLAPLVYSMHKWTTRIFVEAISRDFNYKIIEYWHYDFPIKATFKFHTKKIVKIEVGLWEMQKSGN